MKTKKANPHQVDAVVMPLYICGLCGRDTRDGGYRIKKITMSGYVNMLCEFCQKSFEDEIAHIAIKYLNR